MKIYLLVVLSTNEASRKYKNEANESDRRKGYFYHQVDLERGPYFEVNFTGMI